MPAYRFASRYSKFDTALHADMCTKIVNFKFDMANTDDWEASIRPFTVGNRGTTADRSARTNAATYDLMHQRNLGATMADITKFRNFDKIMIPTNLFHVAPALRQYWLLLYMLHKSTHLLIIEIDYFFTACLRDEMWRQLSVSIGYSCICCTRAPIYS
jgi:hypothetical protein